MKKLLAMVLAVILLAGCGNSKDTEVKNILDDSFDQIMKDAKGTEVNIFMWGGDDNINKYIDEFVAPMVLKEYDVTLKRVPADISTVLQKLGVEKDANSNDGTIDIVWINGENFVKAKNDGLLYGEIANVIPNVTNINPSFMIKDAGEDISNLEVAWGNVSFAFTYNTKYVTEDITSIEELLNVIDKYPGKFTYPEATDFTGSTFIKLVAMSLASSDDSNVTSEQLDKAYETLSNLKANMWHEGNDYPTTLEQLDKLYADEEVYFTMGFNVYRTEPLILDNVFPATSKTVVLGDYTISNSHYLSVPFNAPNPAGAAVVINYLISEEAQQKKLDTTVWGDGSVLSSVTGTTEIEMYGTEVPDSNAETTEKIKETWYEAIFANN